MSEPIEPPLYPCMLTEAQVEAVKFGIYRDRGTNDKQETITVTRVGPIVDWVQYSESGVSCVSCAATFNGVAVVEDQKCPNCNASYVVLISLQLDPVPNGG